MKRMVDVKILGQTFTVASQEREEHLRRVAEMVDGKMREISRAGGANGISTLDVAILTALNIASEYQKLKDDTEELRKAIDGLSSRVQIWLED
jgi:cell division protein ZapA